MSILDRAQSEILRQREDNSAVLRGLTMNARVIAPDERNARIAYFTEKNRELDEIIATFHISH